MTSNNRLQRELLKLGRLPKGLRRLFTSLLMGRAVPFVGRAGIRVEEITPERVVVLVPNRRKNRNHIHSVHAAAMTLAAETASGFVVGMNVPDSRLPLIKYLRVDFKKRSRGSIRAVATLTTEQRQKIQNSERGDLLVEVHATDESGQEPIVCEMCWAWVPKEKKTSSP